MLLRVVRGERTIFLALLVASGQIVEHFVGQLVNLVDDLNKRKGELILFII